MIKSIKTIKKDVQHSEFGITLIALIVTIIILLILAGITVSSISGDNGLLQSAINAKEQSEIVDEKEILNLATVYAMGKNKYGDIDILVSTTVIEVGVDVPEATVMLIENAERFGLSQLHQLRGRVGRNDMQSYCLLIASDKIGENGEKRIKAMLEYKDGFKLAEADLELRGQGDFFGTKQSGMPDLHFADIIKDIKIIQQAKDDAAEILADDNDLSSEKNQVLYNRLKEMYKDSTSYFGIG